MNYIELSKEISYALRHAPWEYELELDQNGWVSTQQLLTALKENVKWEDVTYEDLEYITHNSEKKRHEIVDGKIRALYGHSIPMKILKESSEPPEVLFHGTARHFIKSIEEVGLLPKGRQYVHLSNDTQIATEVGKRHDEKPVILRINARTAYNDGIKFYFGNDKVWLADSIPSKYITVS